jgi:uncharacterized protein (DUF433 family)
LWAGGAVYHGRKADGFAASQCDSYRHMSVVSSAASPYIFRTRRVMMATTEGNHADALITMYIEPHPSKPGVSDAWLTTDRHVPVWVLIGHLDVVQGDVERLARDYGVPREAVNAALAYYERHKASIDARLTLNREGQCRVVSFSMDENVSYLLDGFLRGYGYTVASTHDEGREGSPDPHQLFHATEHDWVLITHNANDVKLLHDAWHLWTRRWLSRASITRTDSATLSCTLSTVCLNVICTDSCDMGR